MEPIVHTLIQRLGGADLMDRRAKHIRRVEHDQVPGKLRLVLLDEVPGGLLRERLARAVLCGVRRLRAPRTYLRDRGVVPIRFRVDAGLALDGEHGCTGGRDDDARAVCERGLEDACGAVDGGYDELVWVLCFEVEWGRGVLDSVDILDVVVEGPGLVYQSVNPH